MCALVLSEGRSKGPSELGDAVLPLQRRYTAPLTDLPARGQAGGEIRNDVPPRRLHRCCSARWNTSCGRRWPATSRSTSTPPRAL
jgi:hypothetical protein